MIDAFVSVIAEVDGDRYLTTVRGHIVAPGLAVVPALEQGRPISADLSLLIHMGSGAGICQLGYCGEHLPSAIAVAIGSGIDWAAPIAEVAAHPGWEAMILELELWVACDHRRLS